jgi:hypothetical protein
MAKLVNAEVLKYSSLWVRVPLPAPLYKRTKRKMTNNLLTFRDIREYSPKEFRISMPIGDFITSGTLCGHLDFVIPLGGNTITLPLTPDEAKCIASALINSADDVLKNSHPYDDPRLK